MAASTLCCQVVGAAPQQPRVRRAGGLTLLGGRDLVVAYRKWALMISKLGACKQRSRSFVSNHRCR